MKVSSKVTRILFVIHISGDMSLVDIFFVGLSPISDTIIFYFESLPDRFCFDVVESSLYIKECS